MEAALALAIGTLTAAGIYLILRRRSFPMVLGLSLISYATNLFLFAAGRITADAPPILGGPVQTDPLPQALVLTAIVISFGMTAVLVMLVLGSYLTSGDDGTDLKDRP